MKWRGKHSTSTLLRERAYEVAEANQQFVEVLQCRCGPGSVICHEPTSLVTRSCYVTVAEHMELAAEYAQRPIVWAQRPLLAVIEVNTICPADLRVAAYSGIVSWHRNGSKTVARAPEPRWTFRLTCESEQVQLFGEWLWNLMVAHETGRNLAFSAPVSVEFESWDGKQVFSNSGITLTAKERWERWVKQTTRRLKSKSTECVGT